MRENYAFARAKPGDAPVPALRVRGRHPISLTRQGPRVAPWLARESRSLETVRRRAVGYYATAPSCRSTTLTLSFPGGPPARSCTRRLKKVDAQATRPVRTWAGRRGRSWGEGTVRGGRRCSAIPWAASAGGAFDLLRYTAISASTGKTGGRTKVPTSGVGRLDETLEHSQYSPTRRAKSSSLHPHPRLYQNR